MAARSRSIRVTLIVVLAAFVAACGGTAHPSASPVAAVATPTPTLASTATPTARPTPTATPRPTPTPAPTATLEPLSPTPKPTVGPLPRGEGKIAIDEVGLTLTLPKGWKAISVDAEDIDAFVHAAPKGMLPEQFQEQLSAMVAAGLRLMAFDMNPKGFGANVTLLATNRVPAEMLEPSARFGLTMLKGATLTGMQHLTIDGRPCLRVDIKLTTTIQGVKLTMIETQLYMTQPHSTLVMTITIPKSGPVRDGDALIKSIHLHD